MKIANGCLLPMVLRYSEPLLTTYKNIFSDIFIIFPPFIEFYDFIDVYNLGYDQKEIELNYGTKLSWKKIIKKYKFNSYEEVGKYLRVINYEYHQNKISENYSIYLKNIGKFILKDNIIDPEDDYFPPSLENLFLESFIYSNYNSGYLNDHTGTSEELIKFEDFVNSEESLESKFYSFIYSLDKNLSYFVPIDTYFILLCSNDKTLIDKIINKYKFEGFYCNNLTTMNWFYNKLEMTPVLFG